MFDLILENAQVIDGSGGRPYPADIGIRGVSIESIGSLKDAEAARRLDISGRTVCPGFIDVHSHADLTLFMDDHAAVLSPLVKQGVTTFVGGNCGMALAPITSEHRDLQKLYLEVFTQMDFDREVSWSTMGSFMEHVEEGGLLINTALLAPHGMMRISACGMETRLAGKDELEHMKRLLEESLEAGAFGLSTGLQYFPGNQSDTDELVQLGAVLSRYNGIFASHLRSYTSTTLPLALDEVAEVARLNGIRGQISHFFSIPWFGRLHRPVMRSLKWLVGHPGLADRVIPDSMMGSQLERYLDSIERHREAGAQLGVDVMPSTTGFTHLMAFFPAWVLVGGKEAVLERLSDRRTRLEIRRDMETGIPAWPHRGRRDWSLNFARMIGWDALMVMAVHGERNKPLEGRRFTEIAKERGVHPFEVMCDLVVEEEGRVLVFGSLAEPDDEFTEKTTFPSMRDKSTMIVTDAILLGIGKPSYLFYGCYPKFIHRYVCELGLIDLPDAVAKCTSLPAEWFGIRNRGLVKEGYFADLLVMEPERFRTEAVFRNPRKDPEGLEMVLINGRVVVEDGELVYGALPGMMLRRNV